jgi:hypothetical protein
LKSFNIDIQWIDDSQFFFAEIDVAGDDWDLGADLLEDIQIFCLKKEVKEEI